MNHDSDLSPRKLDLILNSIEEKYTPQQRRPLGESFLIDCLNLVDHRLPLVASRALLTAKDYQAGIAPLQSVTNAHNSCWAELRREHREMQLDDPEVSAIRAAICILHSQLNPETDDFVDLLSFCLRLLNTVEPHLAEQEVLLSHYFGDYQKPA
jgi:hypothetical protein